VNASLGVSLVVGYGVQSRACLDGRPPVYLVVEVCFPRRYSRTLLVSRDANAAEFVCEVLEARLIRLRLGLPALGLPLAARGRRV